MPDPRIALIQKYSPQNRYANFGPSLRTMKINGFRGITELEINLNFPVTAISGLNGAGKSTVGQLSLSAYKKPTTTTNYNRFYIREFFPASVADPNPFTDDASIIYFYETDDRINPKQVTVSRAASEWSGYKRQPERKCFYIGFTIYIPKVERKDVSIYRGQDIVLTTLRGIPDEIKTKVGRILGQQYDGLHFQSISHGGKTGELGIASRFGYTYSENNMGFGEGRVMYSVDLLENSPEQSLFVIEEPETSLHENAQFEFVKYLLDVCNRRHHQIILSTHSNIILEALPAEGRKLLLRDQQGISVYDGLTSTRARSILSGGHARGLTVCVEDDFAKLLLTEMIRKIEPQLLKAIQIEPIGDTKAVRSAILLLNRLGKNALAVRDADKGPDIQNSIFSFPGQYPPEKEVYLNNSVQAKILEDYAINVNDVFTNRDVTDHHKYTSELASEIEMLPDFLRTISIQKYIDDIGIDAYKDLIIAIQEKA